MSESIKITLVIKNEKSNTLSEDSKEKTMVLTHDSSMTVMSTLLKNNLISGSFCGGRGDCGRCRIRFLKGAAMPTALERSVMDAAELRQGYRLACLAKPKIDCVIELALANVADIAVVTEMIDVTENNDYISQHDLYTENRTSNVIALSSENQIREQTINKKKDVMIAVDLGTTTIAMQLMELNSGQILDTYCEMNPQRRYGADVLSRIQASCDGNREVLQRLVIEALEQGAARFVNPSINIRCMCIAGNTTMEHLLMGYDVSSLGRSPFTPVETGLQEYRHPAWDFTVWLVPGISAFVGGDIVAGLYACGMLKGKLQGKSTERFQELKIPDNRPGIIGLANPVLFVDLGTNGEMAITDGTHMIVTATAAGPAFEGGSCAEIIGSDMVACMSELLQQGIADETGLLREPFFAEGVSIQVADRGCYRFASGRNGQTLYLTQQDIRSLQMAKAAVRAGVEILMKRLEEKQTCDTIKQSCDSIKQPEARRSVRRDVQVYLAGGFGYYLDVEAAFCIGLLPEYMRGHVQAVGNTSLTGAYQVGRDLWRQKTDGHTLERSLSFIESINLAEQEEFERLYIQYMNFK